MGIVAVATPQGGSDDQVSPVFGRCQKFTLFDVGGEQVEEVEVIDNEHASAERGAGTQVVAQLAREGVEAVIAGNFGPKVFPVFEETGVKPYVAGNLAAAEAANEYKDGELRKAESTKDSQSYPGSGPPGGGRGSGGPDQRGGGRGRGQGGPPGERGSGGKRL